MDIVHEVPRMSPQAHRLCVENALSDIDTYGAHGVAAAQAWAVGDLDGIKANYSESRLDACLSQNSAYLALRERGIRDETNAIIGALAKPGKVVAANPDGLLPAQGRRARTPDRGGPDGERTGKLEFNYLCVYTPSACRVPILRRARRPADFIYCLK